MDFAGRGLVSALAFLASVCSASAQETVLNPSLSKLWVVDVGAMFQSLDGTLSAVTSEGKGGAFDLSRLGLDKEDVSPMARLRWRFAQGWRLDLAYDQIDTGGHVGNSTTIDFGRITIPAGYEVVSSLDAHLYSAFVGYAFSRSDTSEIGARVGLTIVDVSANVGGNTYVGGQQVSVGPEGMSMTPLVPTLGLYTTYALSDRLAFEGAVDGIAGTVGAYSGHFLQVSAGLKYWLTGSLAVGGGYRFLDVKMDHDGASVDDVVSVTSNGAYANASFGF